MNDEVIRFSDDIIIKEPSVMLFILIIGYSIKLHRSLYYALRANFCLIR